MDGHRNPGKQVGEIEVGGGIVCRVAAENEQGFDLVTPNSPGEIRDRLQVRRSIGARIGGVGNRRPGCCEDVVEHRSEGVHRRRLSLADENHAVTSVSDQIGGQKIDEMSLVIGR